MSDPCEIEKTAAAAAAVPMDSEPSVYHCKENNFIKFKWKKTPKICHTEKSDVKTKLTASQATAFIISIILMIVTLQVPTILYYKNQPSLSTTYSIRNRIDVKNCSVSSIASH